jgi:AcrR family transcriptional regulator
MTETEVKILDTAERLFGEQGYGATSLRHIIAEAGVNLAAIHYHFGSKEELLDQLIMRVAKPVNEERLALLDRAEAEAGAGPLAVERVLEAFFGPPLLRAGKRPQVVRLMGRMYGEGLMPVIVEKHFHPVVTRFFAALQRALPQLGPEELALRAQFMVGAMAHTMCGSPQYTLVPPEPSDFQSRIVRLVAFLRGGFRAPATGSSSAVRHSKKARVGK